MYNNLYDNDIGNFETSSYYWSSSENGDTTAAALKFAYSSTTGNILKDYSHHVRAIRSFN